MAGRPAPVGVVVAFGAHEALRRCLASLEPAGVAEVVVVDNDGRPPVRAAAAGTGARLVDAGGNVGFAAGVNLGLAAVGPGRDVLLVNPDATLPPDGATLLQRALVATATRGAVAPALLHPDGSPQRSWWPVPRPASVVADALGRQPRGPSFLSGAVLLLRAEALAAVGPFDERFFLYAEEADWQLRAIRAGWQVDLVPAVVARHAGGASSTDPVARTARSARSALLFARKWYPGPGTATVRLASALAAARRWAAGDREVRREQAAVLRVMLSGGR